MKVNDEKISVPNTTRKNPASLAEQVRNTPQRVRLLASSWRRTRRGANAELALQLGPDMAPNALSSFIFLEPSGRLEG